MNLKQNPIFNHKGKSNSFFSSKTPMIDYGLSLVPLLYVGVLYRVPTCQFQEEIQYILSQL